MVWSQGYISDLAYLKSYCRELNPASQAFIASMNGWQAPDLGAPFRKAELGCGFGLSLLMEAAAFPLGQFVGIDFNPAHTEWATQAARLAGLDNIAFLPLSFSELAAAQLSSADFISMHGVWSWVGAESRALIADHIRSNLKPGGLVAVSYNAHPGWSRKRLVRNLMLDCFTSIQGSSTERIAKMKQFLTQFRAASPTAHPEVLAHIDEVQNLPAAYLAHEYLNENWTTFSHGDVAAALSDLHFVGSAKIHESVENLNFSSGLLELLKDLPAAQRETAKDVHANRSFRVDLFGRQLAPQKGWDSTEAIRRAHFAIVGDPSPLARGVVRLPVGKVGLDPKLFQPMLDRLAPGVATGEQLMDVGQQQGSDAVRVAHTLLTLISVDVIGLAGMPELIGARRERCRKLNEALRRLVVRGDSLAYLLSPVTGFGHSVQDCFFFFITAQLLGKDPIDYAWRALKTLGRRMMRDGKVVPDEKGNLEELAGKFTEYECKHRPLFQSLELTT